MLTCCLSAIACSWSWTSTSYMTDPQPLQDVQHVCSDGTAHELSSPCPGPLWILRQWQGSGAMPEAKGCPRETRKLAMSCCSPAGAAPLSGPRRAASRSGTTAGLSCARWVCLRVSGMASLRVIDDLLLASCRRRGWGCPALSTQACCQQVWHHRRAVLHPWR